VIASSGTALGNLAYLIGAIVLAVLGGIAVWLRHRKPKSVDANMASFKRGLNALAPDLRPGQVSGPGRRAAEAESRVQATPMALTHVRVERAQVIATDDVVDDSTVDVAGHAQAAEADAKLAGGDPG
jgi:hypothetical protein